MTLIRSPIHSPIRSPIYSPLVGKWGDADPLGAWLLGTTSADYDARKLDRLFQDSPGQTAVTASGDKVGLWLDGSQFGTKTLQQVIAGQAELRGSFATGLSGSATAATYNTGTGVGSVTRVDLANQSYVALGAASVGFYWFSVTTSGAGISLRSGGSAGTILQNIGAGATFSGFIFNSPNAGVTITSASGTANFTLTSCKAIPGNHGLQATANSRLNYLVSGSRISLTADALDDNLLSSYLAGAGANSILFDIDVPATVSASQVVIGMSGSATARLSLGFNTSGQLCAGVGSDANTTIVGTTDWRGQRLIAALSADGSTVKLLTSAGEEYSAAQNGSPTTTIPTRLAANNNNGTGSSFFGGGIARAIIAQKAMDLATFNAIRNQLLAS
jgi:hypothetical protein